jgi:serine/threonine-protein kinase
MDTALSPPVGQLLGGRYHVDSRIARGGMATVYLGTDTRLDRVIALKIAHPDLSDDAEFVRRFIGEARSAARMSSPNVVAIFDQGSDKRLHYIAMEYVPGRTLRQLLNERGRLGVGETLDIMTGVLAGLAAAHDAGFAHRDVKPENVLLTTAGGVKVADFGLARSVAGAVQTKGGMIIGTAAYLAPEQVSGGTSDARTDVYAAGIMLFELLTGIQPHTGESPLAVAHKHVHEVVPPPSSLVGGLSGAVDALVAMATSRDPDLRPANAGQFLRAIAEVRDGQPLPGTSPYQAPAPYEAPAGYGQATQPHPGPSPYHGSVPPPGLPYYGSGPQPGLPGLSGSHPYNSAAAGPFGLDDDAGPLPALDYEPDGYPSPRHWESNPGAVGASALPSLVPQSAELLPAPHGDPASMVNHTLVVSDAGELAPYGAPPGAPAGPRYAGAGYGRRPPGRPRESILQRYLFSHRLMYVSAGLAVVLVIVLASWWFSSGRYEKVPALRGLTLTAARAVLKNQGLEVKIGPAKHNRLPKGEVIRAKPTCGAQARERFGWSRWSCRSARTCAWCLDVSGQSEAAAKAYLQQHHLTPGEDKPAVSSSVALGYVIGTIPRAYSRISEYRKVRLIISEGPGLPSFIGMQVADAEAAAAAGGYHINAVPNANGSEPANTIITQSPSPNTPITEGEVFTVHYSPGPPGVPVPDVTGMSIQQAIDTMHQAGFRITVNHQGPGDTVGSYSPTGTQPKGTPLR